MDRHRGFKDSVREVLGYGARVPILRGILTTIHDKRRPDDPWIRRHPFDIEHGTSTSGFLPPWLLRSGESADAHVTAYAGCQPNFLRQALKAIPKPEDHTFVDFGCGKGRALIVASELPFRKIVGIELAPGLVSVAHRNAKIIRRKFPQRTAIEVVKGDATAMPFPEGNLAIFLYHSFGPELIARMLSRIAEAAAGTEREIFLIYGNPVYGAMVDAAGTFMRWHAESVPYAANEIGFGPDVSDTAVIWRIGGPSAIAPRPGATAPIVVTKPGWKAELLAHSS